MTSSALAHTAPAKVRRPAPLTQRPAVEDVEELDEPFPSLHGDQSETPREPELDPESCDLLGIPSYQARDAVAWVCEALAGLLEQGQSVEISSFGLFRFRPWRPAHPRQLGKQTPIETPYPGPLEFVASPSLMRQLEREMLDSTQIVRCDALFNVLRDDSRLPKGKGPLVIRLVFRTLTEVLMEHRVVRLPEVGLLMQLRRPIELKVDVRAWEVRARPPRPVVFFHPVPRLLNALPGVVQLREEHIQPPPPDEVRVMVPTERHEDLPPGMTLSRASGERAPRAALEPDFLDVEEPLASTSQTVVPTFVAEEDDLLPQLRDDDPAGGETGRLMPRRAPQEVAGAASSPPASGGAAADPTPRSLKPGGLPAASMGTGPTPAEPLEPEEDDGRLV